MAAIWLVMFSSPAQSVSWRGNVTVQERLFLQDPADPKQHGNNFSVAAQPEMYHEWADGTSLTNGSRLFYTSTRGEQDIHEGIKSNQDIFRLGLQLIPNNLEVRHTNALNDYGY